MCRQALDTTHKDTLTPMCFDILNSSRIVGKGTLPQIFGNQRPGASATQESMPDRLKHAASQSHDIPMNPCPTPLISSKPMSVPRDSRKIARELTELEAETYARFFFEGRTATLRHRIIAAGRLGIGLETKPSPGEASVSPGPFPDRGQNDFDDEDIFSFESDDCSKYLTHGKQIERSLQY